MKSSYLCLVAVLVGLPSFARAQATIQTADPQSGQLGRAPIVVQRCEQNGTAVACGVQTPSYSAPASFAPSACSASTVGTSATLILDTIANGTKRNGGGFTLPPTVANGIYFSWVSATPTTTASGTTFYLAPGGTIPFAGAPNTALYAIAAAGVNGSCFYD